MSESSDLRRILKSWPYDPENDTRIVSGENGREVLQVRTPVGIEQYEVDGRPDGIRPHGLESALEYHLRRFEEAKLALRDSDFELSQADCAELFSEGTLYYLRYVRFFQLKDWARTIRDTTRNLRVFDFVNRHAQRQEDKQFLERWRPYILRINACAAAMQALDGGGYEKALQVTNETVAKIRELDEMDDETFQFERERSLEALGELAKQIQQHRPLSEVEQLERQLERAIERQEFESAARLRDKIRALRKQPT